MTTDQQIKQIVSAEVRAIHDTFDHATAAIETAVNLILESPGKVVITGLGKSGLIGKKISATFASTGQTSVFLNASEALHGDLGIVDQGDVVMMLSNGAATPELSAMIPSLRRIGVQIIGIFGKDDTPLAKAVDTLIQIRVPEEGCPIRLAPMASTTSTLVVGDVLAGLLMKRRNFEPNDFALYHPAGLLGRRLLFRVNDVMKKGDDLPVVSPEASFSELVFEMTRTNLGIASVCDGSRLLGVVSDGDIRRALGQPDPFALQAQAIMTTNPRTISPEATLDEAIITMEKDGKKVYVLPVVEKENLVGIIRMHDVLGS